MQCRRRELVFKLRLPVLLMQHKLKQQAHKLPLHKVHKLQLLKVKPLVQWLHQHRQQALVLMLRRRK